MTNLSIIISIGKYNGFFLHRGYSYHIGLGPVGITIIRREE